MNFSLTKPPLNGNPFWVSSSSVTKKKPFPSFKGRGHTRKILPLDGTLVLMLPLALS
jgi:hypothetical protein